MKARLDNDLDDAIYDDADVSTEPFTSQAAFGRGLWKNPIKFVSAAPDLPSSNSISKSTAQSVRERYLAIVFPNGQSQPKSEAKPLCGVCGEPVKEADARAHYISPGHQAALPRAPIPSSIDRTRMGLKYLEKHGFDLDARLGLGATGQGMLFPIVPKEKRDKLGLGIDKKEEERRKAAGIKGTREAKELKLDAGKVRKLVKAEKKKHEKLQRMFYGNDEVEKYLGELDG